MNLNVTIINGYHHKNCTRLLSLQNMSLGRLYSLCDAHPPQMMWKTLKNYEENVHKYEGNVHKNVENVHKYVENVHKYVENVHKYEESVHKYEEGWDSSTTR